MSLDPYRTTFLQMLDADYKPVTVARVWDTYSQSWRLCQTYEEIPLRVRATMSGLERDRLRIRLARTSVQDGV